MNISFRNISMTVLLASGLFWTVSCAKWTETESLPIRYPDIMKDAPELYEEYCKSLRDYRDSEHKVAIAKFDNKMATPGGRADHINCLPDSIDYVVLTNPDNILPVHLEEIREIREKKGIYTLYPVSYEAIKEEYVLYMEAWNAAHPETTLTETGEDSSQSEEPLSLENFVNGKLDQYFSYMDKYGYDGMVMGYIGRFPASLTGQALEEYRVEQAVFFDRFNDWAAENEDKLLFFEGMPINVIYDVSFFDRCKYIIADATEAVNINEISYLTSMALSNSIPLDRIVAGVAAPAFDDIYDERGLFAATDANGNRLSAIAGAGEWAAQKTTGYTRAGICIMRSQNDYYHTDKAYRNIRLAISTMNPSQNNR